MYENRKKYSQNLLKTPILGNQILEIGNILLNQKSLIVEIGPGKGLLTREIIKHITDTTQLVCIEIDPFFSKYLRKEFQRFSNVEIINKNILDYIIIFLIGSLRLFLTYPFVQPQVL